MLAQVVCAGASIQRPPALGLWSRHTDIEIPVTPPSCRLKCQKKHNRLLCWRMSFAFQGI